MAIANDQINQTTLTSYLLRFTLRRALVAMAVVAIFLCWLRPDRANISSPPSFSRTFKLGGRTLKASL